MPLRALLFLIGRNNIWWSYNIENQCNDCALESVSVIAIPVFNAMVGGEGSIPRKSICCVLTHRCQLPLNVVFVFVQNVSKAKSQIIKDTQLYISCWKCLNAINVFFSYSMYVYSRYIENSMRRTWKLILRFSGISRLQAGKTWSKMLVT